MTKKGKEKDKDLNERMNRFSQGTGIVSYENSASIEDIEKAKEENFDSK